MPLPEGDKFSKTREEFEDDITAAMGGRAAEQIIFNHLSTGASMDLRQATDMARAMVTKYGMSDKLGPRAYGGGNQQIFLGRELSEQRDYSEHYAEEIDNEVKRILQSAYDRARSILTQNRQKLDELANLLIEQETIDSDAFHTLMDGAKPDTGKSDADLPSLGPAPALYDGDM